MKALSVDMCRSWLAPGLFLDANLALVRPQARAAQRLYAVTESKGLRISEFCREALDWLPVGQERLLIVSGWSAYPPDQLRIFETIRRGCGVSDSLESAPGHLFASTKRPNTDYDDRLDLDVDEETTAMWLMGLMLDWAWEGYAVVRGCSDGIFLGDGFICFDSLEPARIAEASALLRHWELTPQTDFPWALAGPTAH